MPDIIVSPSCLCGTVTAPPSKSAAHRALICAALADAVSTVSPLSDSKDMQATIQVLTEMGSQFDRKPDGVTVMGGQFTQKTAILNCKESGSTFRFLLPVAAALGLEATFCGEGRLPARPIDILASQMKAHGVRFSSGHMPFTIYGKFTGGKFSLPGDVSSQFVSGLLFALPMLEQDSEIVLTSPLESAGYVDMTLRALGCAGIKIEQTSNGYFIKGRQRYRPHTYTVEADYSNAAFWLVAGMLCGDISIFGLDPASAQGDRAVIDILRKMGGALTVEDHTVVCRRSELTGIRIDAAPIPDLVPILAVAAACASGETEIYNAARLRIKESDRLATVSAMLNALGADITEHPDSLIIRGSEKLHGAVVDGANDHRIVMSAAIAALRCDSPVTITGAHAAQKSYPDFFDILTKLGGSTHVV